MSTLKSDSLKKCLSFLREYVDETPLNKRKRVAVLALDQLQRITAGVSASGNSCNGKPRVDGNSFGETG